MNSETKAKELLSKNGVDSEASERGKGPSQASQLVALARERFDVFMSDDGRPYAVTQGGPNIALPLRGKAGLRSQLARLYTEATGGNVPSQSALADAMTVLEGIAAVADPCTPQLRTARHGEHIVVDLASADGRCVLISPDGWERSPRSPVLFRRSGAMKILPMPVREGDGLAKLRDLMNTSEEGFHLLVAWLVASFIPDLPHPILTFRGEQGTGKSKGAAMVIGIVDPSGAPKRTAPRDVKSWATQAFNSWALCIDNVSYIPDWFSDALCRAVTGDGIVDRALYTDDDVVVLEFRRVLAMTTIDAGALAGDLAERLLTIELHTIPDRNRREEAELDRAYRDAHPSILASLFDLLSRVLRALPDVQLTARPRMADFARVLAAVDHVTGWDTQGSYRATAADAVADVLEGEPFARAVVDLVRAAGPAGVCMTAADILGKVVIPEKLPKKWPKDATRAGGQLKRLAPALRAIGIDVDDTQREPTGNRSRLYRLTSVETSCIPAPGAPTAPGATTDQHKRRGAAEAHSTRTAPTSTRERPPSGAAGAEPGAVNATAPASPAPLEQGELDLSGAAGAPGAALQHISTSTVLCDGCHTPIDPALVTAGETTHPCCDPIERSVQ
ncbi:ATP-binding protein [Streptomyces agglomeratus]|uniref:ATP-binding protein n=1 Tax=Streptomyces agglomeratus TaxID=285458 RepID=UPI000ACDB245|nr:ATP-binding protein [Streptomyces agglomeratus]